MYNLHLQGSSHDGDNSSEDLERKSRQDSQALGSPRKRQTWSFDQKIKGEASLN